LRFLPLPGSVASILVVLIVSTYKVFEAQMNDATISAPLSAAKIPFYRGRTARKRRIAERLAQLVAEFDPSPAQEQLLAIAAGHLDDAERCQTAERRVRAANTARRLLKDIPRKRLPVHLPTARELLDRLKS
jgi:hypothetical protein